MKFKIVEQEEKYTKILNDIKNKFDLTGQEDGGKCKEVSQYIENKYKIPQAPVSIWGNDWSWSSIDGHYVNLDGDKIVDYTIQQYAKDIKKDVEDIKVPNIAEYNKEDDCYISEIVSYKIEEE